MKKTVKILIVIVFMLFLSLTAFAVDLQKEIGYSGFLTDIYGVPVTDLKNFTFNIYTVASGGAAIWTESQTNIDVTDGEFFVNLGSVVPLTSVDFHSNTQYWLGITVGTDPELTPRKMLLFVPYAFDAEDVIENRTSDPASPVTGQIWLRTDL